jgi:hypothetical protein
MAKGKGGRPKKQPEQALPEGWQNDVLEMYAQGYSDVEVRCELARKMADGALSSVLWLRWMDEHEEFATTIKGLRQFSEAWWLSLSRRGMIGNGEGQVNPTAWIFNMKNRFGWRDKTEVTGNVTHSHTADSLMAEAAALGLTEEQVFGRSRATQH